MRYGYARVSTEHQDLTPQIEAIERVIVDEIITEKASAKDNNREGLQRLLSALKEGDTLVITKLDRIARNMKEGIELIDNLNSRGVKLHILNMGLLDNSPTSRMIRNILLSVSEWEREIILERQREGIEIARQKGKYKGRLKKYTSKHKGLAHALELYNAREKTVREICEITGISRATLYRAISSQKGS